jgi:hypothetical protein
METMNTMCAAMESKLADLLFDSPSVPAAVKLHVESCEGCRAELAALRQTMSTLDAWPAPEPNPYFMTRFEARLREEKAAPTIGWFERFKTRWMLGPQLHTRPVAAMALTVAVLVGGGAYLNSYWEQPAPKVPQTAAVVQDLQRLDSNSQLLDQLEAMDQPAPDQANN